MSGRLAALPLLALLLAACDNPTGVGAELVDSSRERPEEVHLAPTRMEIASEPDITGFVWNTAASASNYRILSGVTEDPLLGSIRADGYVDFFAPAATPSEAFTSNPVSSATLLLLRSYVYGDTTQPVTLRLHDLPDAWTATGGTADTVITGTTPVTEVTLPPTGGYAEIPLPAAWIDRWDAVLRGTTFAADFHGFRVEPVGGDAVIGFALAGSSLRAVAGGDTTYFLASQMLTGLAFDPGSPAVPDRVTLQDGRGIGVVVPFDFTDERVQSGAVSRIRIEIPVDTLLSLPDRPGYVRPRVSVVQLDAVALDPPDRAILALASAGEDGILRFESNDLDDVVLRVLQDALPVDHFELRVDPARHGLDVLFLAAPTDPDHVPRATLTVVPFE